MRRWATIAKYVLLLALSQPVGTMWHELAGHGLVGVLAGGRIASVEVWGLQIWPAVRWRGFEGHYGECDVQDIATVTGEHLMELAGSMSTFGLAAVATAALWLWRPPGWRRAVLIVLSLWWIDLLTYLLPSWGLRRSLLWGQASYSEPYEAAVALGIPGLLFRSAAIASCGALAMLLAIRIWRDRSSVTRAAT